jgi:hypothetical protein
MDEDNDAASAEIEYLKARELELMEQLQTLEQQSSAHPDWTTAGRAVREIADALRRVGNDALAVQYLTAFARWQTADDACV